MEKLYSNTLKYRQNRQTAITAVNTRTKLRNTKYSTDPIMKGDGEDQQQQKMIECSWYVLNLRH